jgi:hypothetical protein
MTSRQSEPAHRASRAKSKQYRGVEVLRGGWGAALLAAPDHILGLLHGVRVDSKSRVVARILGARHLTQAVLSGYRPSPEVLAMGVWVDTVHALTALGLAVLDPTRARAGLTDTAIGAMWGAAGYQDLRAARATPPAHQRIRDQPAVAVLDHAPAGRLLLKKIDRALQGF